MSVTCIYDPGPSPQKLTLVPQPSGPLLRELHPHRALAAAATLKRHARDLAVVQHLRRKVDAQIAGVAAAALGDKAWRVWTAGDGAPVASRPAPANTKRSSPARHSRAQRADLEVGPPLRRLQVRLVRVGALAAVLCHLELTIPRLHRAAQHDKAPLSMARQRGAAQHSTCTWCVRTSAQLRSSSAVFGALPSY